MSDPGAQPDGPVIRRTVVGDWQELRAIRRRAMAQDPGAFGSTLAQATALTDEEYRRRAASGASLLAWHHGEPAGIVALVPDDEDSADAWTRGWLTSMWVDPAHRGSGLADRLVEAACAQGQAAGVDEVALWVTVDNHGARRLYERCGFALTGRRQPVRADEPDRVQEETRRAITLTSPPRR